MAILSINLKYDCENCTFADNYGRGCKHGIMFPVLLLMSGMGDGKCPNYQSKTAEQIKEQLKALENERKRT